MKQRFLSQRRVTALTEPVRLQPQIPWLYFVAVRPRGFFLTSTYLRAVYAHNYCVYSATFWTITPHIFSLIWLWLPTTMARMVAKARENSLLT